MVVWQCNGQEDTPEHKSPCCHINSDFEITTLPMPPEPPTSRPPTQNGSNDSRGGGGGSGTNTTASGVVGAGSVGGSVLGICARARSNSLNRSTSFHIRDTGGGGGGIGGLNSNNGHHTHHQHGYNTSNVRPDIEGLSEKYWGEILERTVSSNSLHAAMQKSYQQHYHHGHQQQQQQQQQHATGVNNPSTMMTTSFSKQSDLNLHIHEHDDNLVDAANITSDLNKFSTSEPKLCEHQQHHLQHQQYHDIHCAKTKANTEANKSLGAGTGGGGGGGGGCMLSSTNPISMASCGSVPDI